MNHYEITSILITTYASSSRISTIPLSYLRPFLDIYTDDIMMGLDFLPDFILSTNCNKIEEFNCQNLTPNDFIYS